MLVKLGFSGSIATGKTARCNHLVTSLAPARFTRVKLLSADTVGHKTYLPGTRAYEQLIARFGASILDTANLIPTVGQPHSASTSASAGAVIRTTPSSTRLPAINRRALGDIVFRDDNALADLNKIVWPAIKETVKTEIDTFESKIKLKDEVAQSSGRVTSGAITNRNYAIDANIFICEAALLTEAGLDTLFDEVWLLGCDTEEAVRRVVNRDGLDESSARKRIAAQKTMSERQRILEEKGFVTSTPADNQAFISAAPGTYAQCGGTVAAVANAEHILRTFDTTRYDTLHEGLAEIDLAFEAMMRRWVGLPPPPE